MFELPGPDLKPALITLVRFMRARIHGAHNRTDSYNLNCQLGSAKVVRPGGRRETGPDFQDLAVAQVAVAVCASDLT